MMRTLSAVALLLLPLSMQAQAQPLPAPLLDHLSGAWVLRGTIDGKPTTHDVTAEWVLNRQYVRLHEVSRERDGQGRPAYEAIVFIGRDDPSSHYACLWLDTTGGGGLTGQAIGHGTPGASEITFLFEAPDHSHFHTTFRYSPTSDTWQWVMDGEAGGTLQPFARVTLTRKRP